MRTSQRGMTLIEVTIVLAIVSGLMLIVYSMIDQTLRATMFNESHNDLTVMSQRAVNRIQSEIVQGRLVYEEDTDGAAYRAAIQVPAAFPVWTNSLLPVIQDDTSLAPDSGTRYTGNSLLLVRQLEPISIFYDADGNAGTADIELLLDRYRFDYFYLSASSVRSFAGSGTILDLVSIESVEFADYMQLNSLTVAQLKLVAPKVIAAGIAQAWNPGQSLGTSFFNMSGATDGKFNKAIAKPTISVARTRSLFPELRGGRISGRMSYSVAFGSFPIRRTINYYAQKDAARPNFPGGFEVKVCGPAGNRNVITRIVLMSHYGVTNFESQQGFVTTAARF
ncbi:MAG TPA: prepilin-type N-terminal cleavage/methylation domain-containing protein [Thermoanaerobaculia bacterium]|nr:prepilin-type N-terminal cleavage/methylation domain-containing protein [Thermoanaerobaculia bacterium]